MSLCYIDFWRSGDSVKSFPEVQVESPASSSSTKLIIQSLKFIRLIKQVFIFMSTCQLLLITFLPFMCLEMVSRISCSTAFPGTYWGVAERTVISWVLFLALLEARNMFYFSVVPRHTSEAMASLGLWSVALQSHHPLPLALVAASHRDPQTCKTAQLEHFLTWSSSAKTTSP